MSVSKLKELARGAEAPSDQDLNRHAQRIMGGGGRTFAEAYEQDVGIAHSNPGPYAAPAAPRRPAAAPAPAPRAGETTGQQILSLLGEMRAEFNARLAERDAELLEAIQQLREQFSAAGIRTVTEAVAHPHGDFDNIEGVLKMPPVVDPRGRSLAPIVDSDPDGLD